MLSVGLSAADKKNESLLFVAVCIGWVGLLLVSCGGSPYITQPEKELPPIQGPGTCLIVIPPATTYTDMDSEQPLPISTQVQNQHKQVIAASVETWVSRTGAQYCDRPLNITDDILTAGYDFLQKEAAYVSDGYISPETATRIRSLSSQNTEVMLLFTHYRVKPGAGSNWNANTGQMNTAPGTATLSGVLVRAATAEFIWQNAIVQRQIVEVEQPQLNEAVNLLFGTQIR